MTGRRRITGVPLAQAEGLTSSTRRARPRRARETTIACQQHGIQHFCQCKVNGIVGAQILSKFPDPIEQRFVNMALQV